MACRQSLAVMFLLLSANPGHAAEPNIMEGAWYTEGVENGTRAEIFFDNRPDGTFAKEVRGITNCSDVKDWREAGTWTFDGSRFRTVTKMVDGESVDSTSSDYNDTFAITMVDEDHSNMLDLKTRVTWPLHKVAPTFEIPHTACAI